MAEGPPDELTLTENAQPAIMANALATLRVSGIDSIDKADFVAGHSLGEYSALVRRRQLRSSPPPPGCSSCAARRCRRRCRSGRGRWPPCSAPASTSPRRWRKRPRRARSAPSPTTTIPSQVVISGHRGAVERALEIAKEKGAKRALLLPVSAPFHSPLMEPAAGAMEQALADAGDRGRRRCRSTPTSPPRRSRTRTRSGGLLVEQVTGMVRWRESVAAMAEAGVDHFVEFGGKVLGPMVKRIAPDAQVTSVVTMDDIDALVKEIDLKA